MSQHPFALYNPKGYKQPTDHNAYYGVDCFGLKNWEALIKEGEEIYKREVIEEAAKRLNVSPDILGKCWESWRSPVVQLIPVANARVSSRKGMHGEYSEKHLFRLMLGYKLTAHGNRYTVSVPSSEAHERGRIVAEKIKQEAVHQYPELTKEEAFTRFLSEHPSIYEEYLNQLKSQKWKLEVRPGLVASLINLLEQYKVHEVFTNKDSDGKSLISLKIPLLVWQHFVRIFGLMICELETGRRCSGTAVEEDDLVIWELDDDGNEFTWRLRESKLFA